MKKVIVLGSTGSIGTSALDIIKNHPQELTLVAISASTNERAILEQASHFKNIKIALSGLSKKKNLIHYHGEKAIKELLDETEADIVVNGIPGAAGLLPSIWTLENSMDLALANKETMVLAGPLIRELAKKNDKQILPVDSEHSALFYLLQNRPIEEICEIVITASGGPFFGYTSEELLKVSKKDALKHPTWDMGYKISIDSATLANKGLEVIEAWRLFDIDLDKIKVLVHQQSYVHSLIRTNDLAMYAQISHPDMRLPIQNALFHPYLKPVQSSYLDLAGKNLSFLEVDHANFPMLNLAYKSAKHSMSYPIAYNAVNEIAVNSFVEDKIHFTDIATITEEILQNDWTKECNSFDEVFKIDKLARIMAEESIRKRI